MAEAKRQDGVPTEAEERLQKHVFNVLTTQIAEKRNAGSFGRFGMVLYFSGGRLDRVEMDDNNILKASDYERRS